MSSSPSTDSDPSLAPRAIPERSSITASLPARFLHRKHNILEFPQLAILDSSSNPENDHPAPSLDPVDSLSPPPVRMHPLFLTFSTPHDPSLRLERAYTRSRVYVSPPDTRQWCVTDLTFVSFFAIAGIMTLLMIYVEDDMKQPIGWVISRVGIGLILLAMSVVSLFGCALRRVWLYELAIMAVYVVTTENEFDFVDSHCWFEPIPQKCGRLSICLCFVCVAVLVALVAITIKFGIKLIPKSD